MRYPVPHRKLRRIEAPARWIFRVGLFFVICGIFIFPFVLGFDTFNPWAIARRANSACRKVVTEEELKALTGLASRISYIHDNGKRCRAVYRVQSGHDSAGEQLLSIRIGKKSIWDHLGKEHERLVKKGYQAKVLPGRTGQLYVAPKGGRLTQHKLKARIWGVRLRFEMAQNAFTSEKALKLYELVTRSMNLFNPYASGK